MEQFASRLDRAQIALAEATADAFVDGTCRELDDEDLLGIVKQVAHVARLAEALLVDAAGEVQDRVDSAVPSERLTTVRGCRSTKELVQRLTRGSSRSTTELLRAAKAVSRPTALASGEALPARYPALRAALSRGDVGIDAVATVAGTIDAAGCAAEARWAADEELAASACGTGADGAPAAGVDELRLQAQVWAIWLDQDGAEPREARAMRKRGVTLGACRDGLVPISGSLLPEVAGQLGTLFDAILNPKTDGPALPDGPRFTPDEDTTRFGVESLREQVTDALESSRPDLRSRVQRQHDAFASILGVAARSGDLPTIGGAAPTLVVAVSADDLRTGTGSAHIPSLGAEPVPLGVARHTACTGAVQRVFSDDNGRIRAIHTVERVFDQHQRRAITLRDGNCIISGCDVPAAWCEIHHVTEHSHGGPTHTDNGVLLCWHHHRTLETSGWQIRMRDGVPEIKAPYWIDPDQRWRPATGSPTRLRQRRRRR
ncbi:HNH endonuclease signature motif containing protein [Microbacterium luteum]|uniref:HNH endonuclease signature motif containing protein n=1 Tax=Microbacterium TaxID=33882 RepID=UPI0018887357|nr:HNH endonuclease signature motif containing protein [Microbacterium luteum]